MFSGEAAAAACFAYCDTALAVALQNFTPRKKPLGPCQTRAESTNLVLNGKASQEVLLSRGQ